MNTEEALKTFKNICENNNDVSVAVAAIMTLMQVMEHSNATTVKALSDQLNDAIEAMSKTDNSVVSMRSGSALFMRFITLSYPDLEFKDLLREMLGRAQIFLEKVRSCREKIAKSALPIVRDGARILLHSKSRSVLEALRHAAKAGRSFSCHVTTCSLDQSGEIMARDLRALGVPCTVISDLAIGYIMEQIDAVILGAEAVVESGGIINRLGTFTITMVAKEYGKPVYVLAESFKFVRFFPVDQRHLPDEFKYPYSVREKCQGDYSAEHPVVDYTPPQYISMLVTDLGVLTTSAVSDELIKLYMC